MIVENFRFALFHKIFCDDVVTEILIVENPFIRERIESVSFKHLTFLKSMKLYFFLQNCIFAIEPHEPEVFSQDWLTEIDWITNKVFLPSHNSLGHGISSVITGSDQWLPDRRNASPNEVELHFISN